MPRVPIKSDRRYALLAGLALLFTGCASSPYAGTWNGTRVPSKEAKKSKPVGYSETKPSVSSTLNLEGNGTYTAKLQEVDYTGTWKVSGSSLVLNPETYMGMTKANFPATKQAVSGSAINSIFNPYELEIGSDPNTLTHTDRSGVVTFKKSG